MVAGKHPIARYVPTLRGKAGELDALAHLSPLAKSCTVPVIDIPKPPDLNALETERRVAEKISAIGHTWGTAQDLYIDMSRYGIDEATGEYSHPVTKLFEVARQCRLRALPVCGTTLTRGPGTAYIDAVSSIANLDRRGLAIRLLAFEFVSSENAVKELLSTLKLLSVGPADCDIILDFEAFDRLPTHLVQNGLAVSTITEVIEALENLQCRSITISGSSIPERVGKRYDAAPLTTRRLELEIWKEMQQRIRSQNIGFGDYGIVYAFQTDGGAPVQPPCRIRISTEDGHILYRSPPNSYRSLRSQVRRDGILQKVPDCWGRRNILGQGRGFTGVGNATNWVAWDTNLHLEGTARLVRDLSSIDRGKRLATRELDRWPWLQAELEVSR